MIALMAAGLLTMATIAPAFAGGTKVGFCHANSDTGFSRIDVKGGAVDLHMADWADYLIVSDHSEEHAGDINHATTEYCDDLVAG